MVGDGAGEGRAPEVDDEAVWFNGVKANAHETFAVDRTFTDKPYRNTFSAFCKTARKPYDLAVTAVLIAARHHFGVDFVVYTDGENADWNAARELLMSIGLDYGDIYHLAGQVGGRPRLSVVTESPEENP